MVTSISNRTFTAITSNVVFDTKAAIFARLGNTFIVIVLASPTDKARHAVTAICVHQILT
jgi:hypothetical protein